MSLINDALKRATQTQPAAPPPAQTDAPMQPATPSKGNTFPAYFVPILLLMLSVACWFLVKAWEGHRRFDGAPPGESHAQVVVAAREMPEPPAAPVRTETAPGLTNATAAGTNAAPSAPPKPPPPTFKLQGIFYRVSRPSAVVNGKSLYVGDRVGPARVKAITQESVTLDLGGRTQVLTLP